LMRRAARPPPLSGLRRRAEKAPPRGASAGAAPPPPAEAVPDPRRKAENGPPPLAGGPRLGLAPGALRRAAPRAAPAAGAASLGEDAARGERAAGCSGEAARADMGWRGPGRGSGLMFASSSGVHVPGKQPGAASGYRTLSLSHVTPLSVECRVCASIHTNSMVYLAYRMSIRTPDSEAVWMSAFQGLWLERRLQVMRGTRAST
jgi:hypothetical protein